MLRPAAAALALLLASQTATAQSNPAVELARLQISPLEDQASTGFSVSIDGTRAVVGAPYHDILPGNNEGAVLVFDQQPSGAWTLTATLTAGDPGNGDRLGTAVSVEGDRIVAGAPGWGLNVASDNRGALYVFERVGGVWTQAARLLASDQANNDNLGWSVSLSGDVALGGCFLDDHAGGSDSGSAYVFERVAGVWGETQKLTVGDAGPGDWFGFSVSMHGSRLLVGAPQAYTALGDTGTAYVFERPSPLLPWQLAQKLAPNDPLAAFQFGEAVALRGARCVVGSWAFGDLGSAYVFDRGPTGVWTQAAKLVSSDLSEGDMFGTAVAVDGDRVVVGASSNYVTYLGSSAYVFERQANGTWPQMAQLNQPIGTGGYYGWAVALQGDRVCVGAYDGIGGGTAHLYRLEYGKLSTFGAGKPGCFANTIGSTSVLSLGRTSTIFHHDAPVEATTGLLLIGDVLETTGSPYFGIGVPVYVDLLNSTEAYSFDVLKDGGTQLGTFDATVPNDPHFLGKTFTAQILWAWQFCNLPPYQLSASPALLMTIAGT